MGEIGEDEETGRTNVPTCNEIKIDYHAVVSGAVVLGMLIFNRVIGGLVLIVATMMAIQSPPTAFFCIVGGALAMCLVVLVEMFAKLLMAEYAWTVACLAIILVLRVFIFCKQLSERHVGLTNTFINALTSVDEVFFTSLFLMSSLMTYLRKRKVGAVEQ